MSTLTDQSGVRRALVFALFMVPAVMWAATHASAVGIAWLAQRLSEAP